MCAFEQDFKQAIENLQEERKLQKKRSYDVHYCTTGTEPDVLVKTRIQGGSSGRGVEVTLTAKGCKVIVPQIHIKKSFTKNELNSIIECIKGFLENPLTDQ